MKEMNMTRAEFYKKCGFSKTSYYNLTANVPSMTLENIENIAKALNVSFLELVILFEYVNPLELLHPMPLSKAREIVYENKSLLKANNIRVVDLTEAEIIRIASVLDIVMSLATRN